LDLRHLSDGGFKFLLYHISKSVYYFFMQYLNRPFAWKIAHAFYSISMTHKYKSSRGKFVILVVLYFTSTCFFYGISKLLLSFLKKTSVTLIWRQNNLLVDMFTSTYICLSVCACIYLVLGIIPHFTTTS